MITLFIVIGDLVLRCLGNRFCEPFSALAVHSMWVQGAIELMFEAPILGGIKLLIYRRKSEKIRYDEKTVTIEPSDTQPINTVKR